MISPSLSVIDIVDDNVMTLILVSVPLSRDIENTSLEASIILSSRIYTLTQDDFTTHGANVS